MTSILWAENAGKKRWLLFSKRRKSPARKSLSSTTWKMRGVKNAAGEAAARESARALFLFRPFFSREPAPAAAPGSARPAARKKKSPSRLCGGWLGGFRAQGSEVASQRNSYEKGLFGFLGSSLYSSVLVFKAKELLYKKASFFPFSFLASFFQFSFLASFFQF